MLRQSERGTFKKCPLAWYWGWHMGLKKNEIGPESLWFGTGVHLALAYHYIPGLKRGIDPRETWASWTMAELIQAKADKPKMHVEELELWHKAIDLGAAVLDNYMNTYGLDESWEFIAPEQAFSVLIPHPRTKKPVVKLVGTFDGVYRDLAESRPSLRLLETKTAASIQTGHLTIDDQAGTYWAVATHVLRQMGLIGPKEVLDGITYNFLRKAELDSRPMNANGEATNKPTKTHYIDALWTASAVNVGLHRAFEEHDMTHAKLAKLNTAQLQASADKYGLTVLGDVSKVQPAPYFHREDVPRTKLERKGQIYRIGAEAIHIDFMRENPDLIYKSPRYDCKRFCDFFEMCEVHEAGGDWEELAKQFFHVVDRYEDHRVNAVG